MLLITNSVTNLLSEPATSHTAVVLINRPGHCAHAEHCSLVCLSMMSYVCVVCLCTWASESHIYYDTRVSFSKPHTSSIFIKWAEPVSQAASLTVSRALSVQ